MKKIGVFLFLLFLFCATVVNAKRIKHYSKEGEVKAKIIFPAPFVTTKNLDQKLAGISYTLQYGKIMVRLAYHDDRIKKRVDSFSFTSLSQTEQDYKKLLEDYGLYDDLEQVDIKGVFLSEITIFTKEKNLEKLLPLGYEIHVI